MSSEPERGDSGSAAAVDDGLRNLELLAEVPIPVTAELGSVSMPVADILSLRPGFIIGLDKAAQEPVSLMVNGRLFAHCEVVVVEEHFAVRLTELARRQDQEAQR